MRRILIDHARRKGAGKRAGERHGITLIAEHAPSSEACGVDVLTVDDAIRRLEAVDGRLARVVELRFFAGLTVDEVAQALQVSARTVASDWRLARAWLSREFDGERAP
jgi:RNA polymerase sigma factor (TIGR02999 family)